MIKIIVYTFFLSSIFAHNARVEVLEKDTRGVDGSEDKDEFISVDLRKPNEDIKFMAEVRIHLRNGQVHINNHPVKHDVVHSIRMMVMITDIVSGVKSLPQRKSVELRVLVDESNINGQRRLVVEEEFITVGDESVEQIEIKQLVWESDIRVSVLSIKLSESKIHSKPTKNDHKMFIPDEESAPHLPHEGEQHEGKEHDKEDVHCNRHHRHHHHRHHHRHGHGNNTTSYVQSTRCWYRHLNWKAKISLFSLGFVGLLTTVLFCALCAQRRRRHRALKLSSPIDDTVSVDVEENMKEPKKDEESFDFHFQFDNAVVVDDKKALVENA